MKNDPTVIASAMAVRSQQMAKLAAEGVPIAVETLMSIAKDPRNKPSDRNQAAKIILAATKDIQDATEKPIEDMSPAELSRYRQRLQARLVALSEDAQLIEGTAETIEPKPPESDVFG